jgi:hypothetical protein
VLCIAFIQVYREVEGNGWLGGARVIYRAIDALCFGCLDSFMEWVGLDFDFERLHQPSKIDDYFVKNIKLCINPT